MRFFYTSSIEPLKPQPEPGKSLGGYVSASPVGSGIMGNLFSIFSDKMVKEKSFQVRCLALKNELNDKQRVKFSLQQQSDILLLEVALIQPAYTNAKTPYFEKILSSQSLPYQGEFSQPTPENPIEFEIEDYMGVWLRQSIKPEVSDLLLKDINMIKNYKQGISQIFSIKLEYDQV